VSFFTLASDSMILMLKVLTIVDAQEVANMENKIKSTKPYFVNSDCRAL